MLYLNDIYVYYGSINAVKGVSLEVKEGEITTLIGANGAGKTTILMTISGLLKCSSGNIKLQNKDITNSSPANIVKSGIAHVPEGRRIFPNFNVKENLILGAFSRRSEKIKIKNDLDKMYQFFPRLFERRNQIAGTLSGGEQQMLTMARALMSNPKILLLDEPSLGLAPMLVQQVYKIIKLLNKSKKTILLVEQKAYLALKLANWGYVIENGKIIFSNKTSELLKNDYIRGAYLE